MASNKTRGAIPKTTKPPPVNTSKTKRTPPQSTDKQRPSKLRTSLGRAATSFNDSVYQCVICKKTDSINKVCCDGCNTWSHFACASVTNEMLNKEDQWFCQNCSSKMQMPPMPPVTVSSEPGAAAPNNNDVQNETSNPSGQITNIPVITNVENSNVVTATTESNEMSAGTGIVNPVPDQTAQGHQAKAHSQNSLKSHKSKSVKSTTSSSKRRNLAMQRLEEEQRLIRERQKEEQELRRQQEKEVRERRERQEKEYLDKKYSLLADESSDESLTYDGFDETLNRVTLDPVREAEIDQWVRHMATKDIVGSKVKKPNHSYNLLASNVPQTQTHFDYTLSDPLPLPSSQMQSAKCNGGSSTMQPNLHQNQSQLNLPPSLVRLVSTAAQFNVDSSTNQPISAQTPSQLNTTATVQSNMHVNSLERDSLSHAQEQAVTSLAYSATMIDPLVVTNDVPVFGQRTTLPYHINPISMPSSATYLPSNSMISSTFVVNPSSTSIHNSGTDGILNQPTNTFGQVLIARNQQPIMSSVQQPSLGLPTSQIYQPSINQQAHQARSSNPMMSLGYSNPISTHLNYQPIYSTNQVPPASLPYQMSNTSSQHNNVSYSSLPASTGQQPNFNLNHGINLLAQGNQVRRLTAEQIAARQTSKELPHFYGNPDEWQIFISAFENANAVCGYNNHENLNRLITCLKGDARVAVKSLLVHADAVPDVIRTLFIMYGRPEVVIESLIQEIQKEPAPKDDDLAEIMKFAIKVRNLSRAIVNTGAVEHLNNTLLITTITNKLPAQLLLQWACYRSAVGAVDLTILGNWCNNIAEATSLVVRPKIKLDSRKRDQAKDKNPSKSTADTANYVNAHVESASKNNDPQAKKPGKCPVCKSESCTKITSCKRFKELKRNERLSIVKDNKLCTRCLGNHHFYRCRSNFKCKVENCNAKHHILLHDYEKTVDAAQDASKNRAKENGITNSVDKFSSNASHSNSAVAAQKQRIDKFRIVPIIVSYKGRSVNDFAYLDDGSNMTSMEKSLTNELNANGTSSPICVEWAFGQRHTFDSKIVSVRLSGCYNGAEQFELNNVRTVDELHLPTQSITASWLKQFDYLNGIPISTYESAKPRILIGLQYSRLMVSLKTVEGTSDEPVACKTRLGWVIQGPSYKNGGQANQQFSMNICECQVDDGNLHQLVKDYFHLDNLGVEVPSTLLDSRDNQVAKQIMESTTSKVDGRYETGLLWKHDKPELPNSYPMALKRLKCLEAKMLKDPKLADNLRDQMRQFIDKKYIRKLTADELHSTNNSPIWYLPVFPAFNPKKPEKVRIVWDGAAKVMNISINSLLLTGPDQLVPLPDILRKFRERLYAILGDIKEMFHQIKVIKADQNAQRFLWRNGDQSREPDVYIMMVVTFGLTCSPSQAQYIKNRNAFEFIKEYPEAVDTIINKHYVDDMLDCAHTIDEAEKRIREVKYIHKEGGFEIRNFLSNSKELLQRIGETSENTDKNMNISIDLGTERVLGMYWNAKTDCFTFSLKYTKINKQILSGEHHPTKREVLRVLMSVFDPLGLLAHYLIHAKILIQEIWRTNIDWDDKINQPNLEKWTKWIITLPDVENIEIPRLYSPKLSPSPPKSIQIHTFVDASCEAYATAVYLRIEDDDGVDCCLVSAKTKVAPNKPMTVPRLELQGAVLGTRLANSVKSSQTFTIDKCIYWTDSLNVMGWVNSEARKYKQFVAFRVGVILESTEPIQWRWVPSEHNVADEATKSKEIANLNSSSRWYKAPEFLYDNETTWFTDDIDHVTEEEIRPSFSMAHRELARPELIDLTRFSQWNRLMRAQAYVFRFMYNIRHQQNDRRVGPLKQEEIDVAEKHLYRLAQMDQFLDEIIIMRYNQRSSLEQYKKFDRNSVLRTYSPYLDEYDVIRMKGRIDATSAVSYETKRPIILPRKHHITRLIVDHYHRRYKHANHSTALNEIRQKYVIPALRVVMKGIRTSCQRCKNLLAEPKIPEMAELPSGRLAVYTLPYTYVGLDYFGPLRVRNGRVTRNRPVVMEKRWVLLFTCLTTRAVWMEIAHSMDTSSCIMCIDNFMLRKGRPREFYSDNGLSFHSSEKELSDEFAKIDQHEIEERFTSSEMVWKFNPPATPHMGGVWERLISTVKTCLKETMKSRTPNDEMLKNFIIEAEYIVNSRPLTYVSLETADDEALTPNHILMGSSNGVKPLSNINERDLARNTYKAVQVLANNFWHRFVLEYLPTLTRRTKWFNPAEPIKVGDVVVIIDEKGQRNSWPKAIVEQLLPGKRGIVRQVMVRTTKGIRKRSVSKLAVLDVKPPGHELVNRNPTGSINGGENVGQRHLNVNDHIVANRSDNTA